MRGKEEEKKRKRRREEGEEKRRRRREEEKKGSLGLETRGEEKSFGAIIQSSHFPHKLYFNNFPSIRVIIDFILSTIN